MKNEYLKIKKLTEKFSEKTAVSKCAGDVEKIEMVQKIFKSQYYETHL